MGRIRKSRNQREEVAVITQDWVDRHCQNVTGRDMNMLRLLKRFGVMSSRHLYYLTEGDGKYQSFRDIQRGQQRCNERMRVLFDLHCINKFSPLMPHGEGTSVQYAWLDRAGAKLLEIENFKRRTTIPQDYMHTSLLLDVYCECHKQFNIKYQEIEQKAKTWPLIPDLLLILKIGNYGYIYIIEIDRCEKKEKDEIEKLQSYRDWQLSNQWLNEKWAKVMPRPLFPRVIYAFDDKKSKWKGRATRMKSAADKIGLRFTATATSSLTDTIKALAQD